MILIVVRVAVVMLLLLALGCGDSGRPKYRESQSKASEARGEYVLVKTVSGKGSKSTDEFRISSSKVKLKARTWGSTVGSFSSFSLESDSGRYVRGGSMTISTDGSDQGESSTTIRSLNPGGYYYINAISGIYWEVNVYEYR